MGGSNSHVLTVFDVARVREWLLIALQGRFRIENARKATSSASSIQHFLLQTFERYDAVSTVALRHCWKREVPE